MEFSLFMINSAVSLSMLLLIYSSYLMVKHSKGKISNAFKIMILFHIPLLLIHIILTLHYGNYIKLNLESEGYKIMKNGAQIASIFSVFFIIYTFNNELFQKIEKFGRKKVKEK